MYIVTDLDTEEGKELVKEALKTMVFYLFRTKPRSNTTPGWRIQIPHLIHPQSLSSHSTD